MIALKLLGKVFISLEVIQGKHKVLIMYMYFNNEMAKCIHRLKVAKI
jgi:hypothetical protein